MSSPFALTPSSLTYSDSHNAASNCRSLAPATDDWGITAIPLPSPAKAATVTSLLSSASNRHASAVSSLQNRVIPAASDHALPGNLSIQRETPITGAIYENTETKTLIAFSEHKESPKNFQAGESYQEICLAQYSDYDNILLRTILYNMSFETEKQLAFVRWNAETAERKGTEFARYHLAKVQDLPAKIT